MFTGAPPHVQYFPYLQGDEAVEAVQPDSPLADYEAF